MQLYSRGRLPRWLCSVAEQRARTTAVAIVAIVAASHFGPPGVAWPF
jgi:hypothetical protein